MKMLRYLCLFVVILSFGCKKENANRNNSVINTTPKSIIYQDLDTATRNYVTTQTIHLFPDSAGIYFDSVHIIDAATSNFTSVIFNHDLFNSKKYLSYKRMYYLYSDSNDVSIIKFDSNNRISEIHDEYSLQLDEPTLIGFGANNELMYSNFSTPYTHFSHFASTNLCCSVNSSLLSFDFKTANNDSITVESGRHPDGLVKHIKYTIILDEKENNCNLMQLSGIIHPVDGLNSESTHLFKDIVSRIPLPNIKTKLVKSIYITQIFDGEYLYPGISNYIKYADFNYEFDSENRITKAIITPYYDIQYFTSEIPFYPKRILFTY